MVRIDVALPHPIKRTLWNICHVAPQSRGLLIVAFWTDSYKRNREKCNNHNNNIHIYMYIHILLYLLFFSFFCCCCLFSLSFYRNRFRMQQLIVLQIRKVHVPTSRKVHVLVPYCTVLYILVDLKRDRSLGWQPANSAARMAGNLLLLHGASSRPRRRAK